MRRALGLSSSLVFLMGAQKLPEERFFSKVEKTRTCWIWQGALNEAGYPHFWFFGRAISGTLFSLSLVKVSVPEGFTAGK